jgi:hypothetical protein
MLLPELQVLASAHRGAALDFGNEVHREDHLERLAVLADEGFLHIHIPGHLVAWNAADHLVATRTDRHRSVDAIAVGFGHALAAEEVLHPDPAQFLEPEQAVEAAEEGAGLALGLVARHRGDRVAQRIVDLARNHVDTAELVAAILEEQGAGDRTTRLHVGRSRIQVGNAGRIFGPVDRSQHGGGAVLSFDDFNLAFGDKASP